MIFLCELVKKLGSPDYAFDTHTGDGGDDDWRASVNAMREGSQWQKDAMQATREIFKQEKKVETEATLGRQRSMFEG